MTDIPTIFIVFGVTGDLMKKKIAPALYGLYKQGNLPKHTQIIGFARRPLGEEGFRTHVAELIGENDEKFLSLITYNQGNFTEVLGFANLKSKIDEIEEGWGVCANKLFYLAVPPESYEDIFKHLEEVGLQLACLPAGEDVGETGWTRLLIEKPFGRNEASAKKLDDRLNSLFNEDQIYRIDHYLAKDGVMALKPITASQNVRSVTIRLWEKMTVDGRGPFYETVGALRDVGQNHLLSIFSILTGVPANKLSLVNSDRAQYKGYIKVDGVKPDSQVETYFKVEALLNEGEWQNTKFLFEAGKAMPEIKKEVVIEYKDGKVETFSLELNKNSQYVAEYEQLILDAVIGDKKKFLSREEVETAWQFVDQVIKTWEDNLVPLKTYLPGNLPQ